MTAATASEIKDDSIMGLQEQKDGNLMLMLKKQAGNHHFYIPKGKGSSQRMQVPGPTSRRLAHRCEPKKKNTWQLKSCTNVHWTIRLTGTKPA